MNLLKFAIENDEKERKRKVENKLYIFIAYLYRIEKEVKS